MSLVEKRNNALNVNPNTVNGATADIAITTAGSDLYFAVCAIMTVATITFLALGMMKPRQHRVFHYITAAITMVAAIAYFTMGSNLGWTPIAVEFMRSDPRVAGINREIFYVRYIDWFITTPLLLLDLMLTAAMPWPTILFIILVDEVMIVTGLVGALIASRYKWAYFTFGCAALLYIVWVLVWEGRRHAKVLGADVGRVFLSCGSLTTLLWILYPIAWGVCEGGNVISPNSEAVFYSVLDVLAKPVFGALLIFGHRNIDPARLGVYIHDYDEKDPSSAVREKVGAPGSHNGIGTGSNNTTGATTGTTPAATTGVATGHEAAPATQTV